MLFLKVASKPKRKELNSNMANFKERFQKLRKEKKLTFEQIGALFKKSEALTRRWADGTRKPSLDEAVKLADFFNVTTDYLVGRSNVRAAEEPKKMDLKGERLAKILTEHYEGEKLSFDNRYYIDLLSDILELPCGSDNPTPAFRFILDELGTYVALDDSNPEQLMRAKKQFYWVTKECERLYPLTPKGFSNLICSLVQATLGQLLFPLRETYQNRLSASTAQY